MENDIKTKSSCSRNQMGAAQDLGKLKEERIYQEYIPLNSTPVREVKIKR